ncbi:MAG: cobalamin biosynthesis protein CobD [Selenomonadaceae bacterium]|nr:cobalamin biosynthesis protein CobD [Selenomonadaceae bacterium]
MFVFDSYTALTALTAFFIDMLVGDPRSKFHPVVLMGNLISLLERFLYNVSDGNSGKLLKGGILTTIVISVTYVIGLAIVRLSEAIDLKFISTLIEAITLSFMISPRSLAEAGQELCNLLVSGDIEEARRKVSWIVGRDTDKLDEPEIVRATVETVAENTVDGIISPLFCYMLGGLPLAIAYRAANTMDSMIGYKNDKYLYFGRVAARLDDILNYIPARLTGLLFIISAVILRLNYKNAITIMKRDANKHPSPNGGYAEATVAGALNIRLGGYNSYFGKMSFREYMGDPFEILAPRHILLTIKMMYTSTILFLTIIFIL